MNWRRAMMGSNIEEFGELKAFDGLIMLERGQRDERLYMSTALHQCRDSPNRLLALSVFFLPLSYLVPHLVWKFAIT